LGATGRTGPRIFGEDEAAGSSGFPQVQSEHWENRQGWISAPANGNSESTTHRYTNAAHEALAVEKNCSDDEIKFFTTLILCGTIIVYSYRLSRINRKLNISVSIIYQ